MNASSKKKRRRFNWRYWNIVLHRDVGYLLAVLTIIYAVSGIAVNHIQDWNPNYTFERVEQRFEPIPVSDRPTMVGLAVERLGLAELPRESFRSAPDVLELYYEGWSAEVFASEGRAVVERPKGRFLLRDFNFLHLNHGKGLWTFVADLYAGLLTLMAISGIIMLKGKKGLAGRGKWFVLAGLAVPLVFVIVLRYLG